MASSARRTHLPRHASPSLRGRTRGSPSAGAVERGGPAKSIECLAGLPLLQIRLSELEIRGRECGFSSTAARRIAIASSGRWQRRTPPELHADGRRERIERARPHELGHGSSNRPRLRRLIPQYSGGRVARVEWMARANSVSAPRVPVERLANVAESGVSLSERRVEAERRGGCRTRDAAPPRSADHRRAPR